ncbi:suppressor of tub2 mutation [Boothiomyces sp. JEL0866]|nr:suppressor of tub2 mutation [Boothiomyces sp. JEL0866]
MTLVPVLVEMSFQEKCEILDSLVLVTNHQIADLRISKAHLSKESISNLVETLYKTNQLKTSNQILEILSIALAYQSVHESNLAQHLVEKLGESREKTRELALECLVLMYLQSLFNEELIINAMQSKNYKQREMAILFVVESYKRSKISLKQFIPYIVSNLEHSNESIRLSNEKQIMHNDVVKILKKQGIRPGISDPLLNEFNAIISKQDNVNLIKIFIEEQDLDLGEQKTWPESTSPSNSPVSKAIQPLFLDFHHAEIRLKQMIAIFQGKETEKNWQARQNELLALSAMIHGKSEISSLMKLLGAIFIPSITSLRTAMALTCAATISELVYVYKADADGISDEILPTLMKLLGNPKQLVLKKIMGTCKLVFAHTSLTSAKIHLLTSCSADKSSQIRRCVSEIIQLLFEKKKIKEFNHLESVIMKLLEDSDGQCRSMARSSFLYLQELFPAPSNILYDKLSNATQKAINSHKKSKVELPDLDLEPLNCLSVKYTPTSGKIIDLRIPSSNKANYGEIPPSAEKVNDMLSPLSQQKSSLSRNPVKAELHEGAEASDETILKLLQKEDVHGLDLLIEKCGKAVSLDAFKLYHKLQSQLKATFLNPPSGWTDKLFSSETIAIFISSQMLEWKHILVPLIRRMDQLCDFDKIVYTYQCSKNEEEIMEDLVNIIGGKQPQKVTKYILDWIIALLTSSDLEDYLQENCRKLCNKFIPMMNRQLVEPLANCDNDCFKNVLQTFEPEIFEYYQDLVSEITNISSELELEHCPINESDDTGTSHLVMEDTLSNFDTDMNNIEQIQPAPDEQSSDHLDIHERMETQDKEDLPSDQYLDNLQKEAEALITEEDTMEIETDYNLETAEIRDGPSGLVGVDSTESDRKHLKYNDEGLELRSLVEEINSSEYKSALAKLYRLSRLYHKDSDKYDLWNSNCAMLLNTILVGLVEDTVDINRQEYMLIVLKELVINQSEYATDLKIILEILFSCRAEGTRVSAGANQVILAICSTYDPKIILNLLFEILESWNLADPNSEAYRIRKSDTQPILQPPPLCSLLYTMEQLIKKVTDVDQIQLIVDRLTPVYLMLNLDSC